MIELLATFGPWIAGALALVLAFFGIRQSGKKAGRDAERAARDAETLRRVKAGQKAGGAASASGKSPEEIAKDTDGRRR